MMQPIVNTEPVENEFFLRDGHVYFSGLYENTLLKGIVPEDFHCWHYWGKSSTACFMGGVCLRGADPVSFQVLNYAYAIDKWAVYTTSGRVPDAELATFHVLDNGQNESGAPQGYAKDSQQVYFHNGDGKVKIIKGAEASTFRSFGDTFFAVDSKRIYAYGKQLPKADLTSWELLPHWYSHDAKRVYYLNREIKGVDLASFAVCTPLDAAPLADHMARDKYHFYQNDERIEESLWVERMQEMIQGK
ncbi:DKNYY domain-containing protein [Anaerotignum sp.]|uniref:DKNYY domain-containing protein n=1 Tax=Anaerotignum sp. TaxID=2039241 RepID=UPI003735058B